MKKVIFVVGTRPNFIKASPIFKCLYEKENLKFNPVLVHSGQHYDENMSQVFFDDLNIPRPSYNFNARADTSGQQIGTVLDSFKTICEKEKPEIVVVFGDVNTTLGATLAAKNYGCKIAHIESGLRSNDIKMQEEVNRIVVDRLSDILFTTEKSASDNLIKEGKKESNIFFVGNTMVDNLLNQIDNISDEQTVDSRAIKGHVSKNYLVLTIHRPSNIDNDKRLKSILEIFKGISLRVPVIFPCHPRTKKRIKDIGLIDLFVRIGDGVLENGFVITDPLGYIDFLNIWKDSQVVITDSGGLQEETTAIKKPCLTLRENTERPITIDIGSNKLINVDERTINIEIERAILRDANEYSVPELWDGKASERIIEILNDEVQK